MLKKISVVVGTRPEAIKMAPVVLAIQQCGWAQCDLVLTGQHRDLVTPILTHFGLFADHDLQCMTENQGLAGVTARILERMDCYLDEAQPDAVLAQGDTVSVLGAGLASFFKHIPLGHVEAGLRTGVRDNPFPEEMNRVLTGRLATWHFAPTTTAERHLLSEGVPAESVWVTGNTVIDALKWTLSHQKNALVHPTQGRPYVLITAHRRENFGQGMAGIFAAVIELAHLYPTYHFVIPLHPNPQVRQAAEVLKGISNVAILSPSPYPEFCQWLANAELILSDSGGIQEEAPAIGKPVLVLREETERPEAVKLGANQLVGTDQGRIVQAACMLLNDRATYQRMATAGSPYGDGHSADRIIDILRQALN